VVDGQNAVEVVHFVLKELGHGAGGIEFEPLAGTVLVAEPDALTALKPNHEVGEREAIVPEGEPFRAPPGPLGIDQFVADAVNQAEDDAHRPADLDGANAAPESMGKTERGQGVFEVVQDLGDGGKIVDRLRDQAQRGIAEFEYVAGGHEAYSRTLDTLSYT